MYKTTLSLRPRATGSRTQTSEPGLFDALDLELNETGKPWSPTDPPLADIVELPAAGAEIRSDTFQFEPAVSPVQECAPEASRGAGCDDDTVILEDHEILPARGTETVAEEGVESGPAPEAPVDFQMVPEPVTFIDEPLIEEQTLASPAAPVIEKPVVGVTIADAPVKESLPVKTSATNVAQAEMAAPMTAPSHERCIAQKQGVMPKKIGSGRLVPARLTWKPRDPFACPSKPKARRFRWEVMLTSACITAVCGLGCVWILRTLLA